MAELKSICVYCGAGVGEELAYSNAAVTLGTAIAEAGIRLVYGGGSVGLMGRMAGRAMTRQKQKKLKRMKREGADVKGWFKT